MSRLLCAVTVLGAALAVLLMSTGCQAEPTAAPTETATTQPTSAPTFTRAAPPTWTPSTRSVSLTSL